MHKIIELPSTQFDGVYVNTETGEAHFFATCAPFGRLSIVFEMAAVESNFDDFSISNNGNGTVDVTIEPELNLASAENAVSMLDQQLGAHWNKTWQSVYQEIEVLRSENEIETPLSKSNFKAAKLTVPNPECEAWVLDIEVDGHNGDYSFELGKRGNVVQSDFYFS